MLLTIHKTSTSPVGIGGAVGALPAGIFSRTYDLTIDKIEQLRPTLVRMAAAGIIQWSTAATSDTSDDAAEGATVGLPQTTKITNPGLAINSNTDALTHALDSELLFRPSAQRTYDVSTAPWSMRQRLRKDTRALFGIMIPAAVGWTGPNGLNRDYLLPSSSDQKGGTWTLIIDVPNKTYYVITEPRGWAEPMLAEPSASPGDTLDLFTAGTYTGNGGFGFALTGAPRSDGAAFGADRVNNTRTQENRGDGNGAMLLLEPARTNFVFQNQTLYNGAGAITAPWVAINGNTTGVGTQTGSPLGTATVCNLVFAGSDATTGVKQPLTSTANTAQTVLSFSVWAKALAGTGKFRLQALLKDGTTFTSADFDVTTTWGRYDVTIPNIGLFGSSGTAEFRIINGSTAANYTLQVWRPQAEVGGSPSSAILTVAAAQARTADLLWISPSAVPATFRTRGVSVQYAPDYSNLEQWLSNANHVLVSFDNDPITGPLVTRDWFAFGGSFNQFDVAGGAGRVAVLNSENYRGIAAQDAQGPLFYSPPLTWVRGSLLTLASEAYRGSLNLSGFTGNGNGRFALGGGPWTWPGSSSAPLSGTMTVGGTPGGTVSLPGRYGQFITAA